MHVVCNGHEPIPLTWLIQGQQHYVLHVPLYQYVSPLILFSGRRIGMLKRRVSEVAMKVGAILVDRRYPSVDRCKWPRVNDPRDSET